MNVKVLALVIAFAVMLVTIASASSALSITNAEAVYEADLTAVSVPTTAVPLGTVFIPVTADASIEQDLTEVNIPTTPVPLKTVLISATADASIEQELTGVNVPTSPVPVTPKTKVVTRGIFLSDSISKNLYSTCYNVTTNEKG